ncbi:MAG: RlpA-like double-psi beta-barrel domain-containing protein [Janthinobacterium lividum]
MSGRRGAAAAALCAVVALAGCHRRAAVVLPPLPAHYTAGVPWQGGRGMWFYPAESFSAAFTGLASVVGAHGPVVADGERYDPQVAAAASQTLQLPAVVRVTNLENGRQVLLRVDDRGPADPGRVLALTPRAATLLGVAPGEGATRVRVVVDEALSRRLAEQLHGGPRLDIATAPRESVRAEALGPPGAASGGGRATTIGAAPAEAEAAAVPDRLAEDVVDAGAAPGQLWLRTDSFGRADYARRLAAKLSGLPAEVVRTREGRSDSFAVRAGPFATVAEADDALDRALRAGVTDARIVVQ